MFKIGIWYERLNGPESLKVGASGRETTPRVNVVG